jgi:allantoinase
MAAQRKFGIVSRRVLTPDGLKEAVVVIDDGKIVDLKPLTGLPADLRIEDAGDNVVMAGLVDSHVHVNEPGRTEWEGFQTATRAAAAGGITTICDMPLNSDPVTVSVEALAKKLEAAKGKLTVDCAFWGGVVPGNSDALNPMIERGVRGFKCFLIHSGIDDFPNVTKEDLALAMPILAKAHVPLLVHAELDCGHAGTQANDTKSYQSFLESRPRIWENEAIKLMIDLCRQYNCPVHIVHLSSTDAIPLIKQAKKDGLPITAETCPHYLTFAAEEIPDGDPRFKCAPPIREKANRESLWQAVFDGTIDFIVSDHSPCTKELKFLEEGNLQKAWGGISSLQFGLSIIWTEGNKRGLSVGDVSRLMSERPAQFLRLEQKGKLAIGMDADLVVWNPEESTTIKQSVIEHRNKVTPYDGRQLFGVVKQTYVRGEQVFNQGTFSATTTGKELLASFTESRR